MEIIYDKQLDVRNFHKKISQLSYIIPPTSGSREWLTGRPATTASTRMPTVALVSRTKPAGGFFEI